MDSRLQVNDAPRAGAPAGLAEMPLVTIAWRVLRAEHQRRADERRRDEAEVRQVREALADVAEEVHRLRCAARGPMLTPEGAGQARQLLIIADRLEQALAKAEVAIVAPEGGPYTADWMELLDNIAQRPEAQTREPRVAEVITPAILFRGALLRRGKAVISIPVESDQTMDAIDK